MKELVERYKTTLEEILLANEENEFLCRKDKKTSRKLTSKPQLVSEKQIRALRYGGKDAT